MPQDGRGRNGLNNLQPSEKSTTTSYFRKIKPAALVLTLASFALLQPIAFAQSQMKPGNESMPGGKAGSSSMQGRAMDMNGMMKDSNEKVSSMKMTGNPDIDLEPIRK